MYMSAENCLSNQILTQYLKVGETLFLGKKMSSRSRPYAETTNMQLASLNLVKSLYVLNDKSFTNNNNNSVILIEQQAF